MHLICAYPIELAYYESLFGKICSFDKPYIENNNRTFVLIKLCTFSINSLKRVKRKLSLEVHATYKCLFNILEKH